MTRVSTIGDRVNKNAMKAVQEYMKISKNLIFIQYIWLWLFVQKDHLWDLLYLVQQQMNN